MYDGYVRLYRILRSKGYYKKSTYVHLWVHLLMTACHKDTEFFGDGGVIHLKKGELFSSRKALSQATGIPEGTVERILKVLENEQQIGQRTSTKYRIITILNWDKFQNPTAERTASGQQADTYKNHKHHKNLVETKVSTGFTIESEKPTKEKKVTPEMQEVFDLFGGNPARFVWPQRTFQRKAAQVLFDSFGVDELKRRYKVIQKHRHDPLCPKIDSPSDFLDKMPKMETFLKNL